MRAVRRTLVFNTELKEVRQHRIELADGEEPPSEEELLKMWDTIQVGGFLADHADDDDWDTIREDDEVVLPGTYRVEEEVYDDGRSEADARYDRDEDAIREDMAAGVRDERGRLT